MPVRSQTVGPARVLIRRELVGLIGRWRGRRARHPAVRDPARRVQPEALGQQRRTTGGRADRAARLDPNDPRAATARALGLLAGERPAEAAEAARRARQLGGDEASCLLIRAIASHRLGRPDAEQLYRRARGLPPPTADRDRTRRALLESAVDLFEPPGEAR